MRVLALETSGLLGSVAALEDEHVVAELSLQPPQRIAEGLLAQAGLFHDRGVGQKAAAGATKELEQAV